MKTKWLVSDILEDITSKSYRSPEELRQLAQALLHKKKNPEWFKEGTDWTFPSGASVTFISPDGTRESTWAQAAYDGTDFEIKVPPSQK